MSNNLKDILSNLNKDIEQQKLLEYLNNELPQADQHAVEEALNDDPFMSDAMDGLQQFENKNDVPQLIHQLNADLKKELDKKKKRKRRQGIAPQTWTYIAIVFILLVCIITYLVMKRMAG